MTIKAEEVEKVVKGFRLAGGELEIDGIKVREVVAGSGILTLDGLFSKEDCQRIIRFYQDNLEHAAPGGTATGVNPDLKLSTDLKVNDVPTDAARQLDAELFEKIGRALRVVQKIFPAYFVGRFGDTGYRIQHYSPGGYYHWHVDYRQGRRLALLLYLNEFLDGGETEFWYQNVKIIPQAGKLLVFPVTAHYTHRGCTAGQDKLIMTSFLVDEGAQE